jgi:hypothetical protein
VCPVAVLLGKATLSLLAATTDECVAVGLVADRRGIRIDSVAEEDGITLDNKAFDATSGGLPSVLT